jgi:hypothetical protein
VQKTAATDRQDAVSHLRATAEVTDEHNRVKLSLSNNCLTHPTEVAHNFADGLTKSNQRRDWQRIGFYPPTILPEKKTLIVSTARPLIFRSRRGSDPRRVRSSSDWGRHARDAIDIDAQSATDRRVIFRTCVAVSPPDKC